VLIELQLHKSYLPLTVSIIFLHAVKEIHGSFIDFELMQFI